MQRGHQRSDVDDRPAGDVDKRRVDGQRGEFGRADQAARRLGKRARDHDVVGPDQGVVDGFEPVHLVGRVALLRLVADSDGVDAETRQPPNDGGADGAESDDADA